MARWERHLSEDGMPGDSTRDGCDEGVVEAVGEHDGEEVWAVGVSSGCCNDEGLL